MKRVLVAVVVLAGVLLIRPPTAFACSCGVVHPRTALERSVVVVGRVTKPGPAAELAVERAFNADLNGTVAVATGEDESSCGIRPAVGARVAWGLSGGPGRWQTSLCAIYDPDAVLAAAEPLPEPRAAGPPVVLAVGAVGRRVIAGFAEDGTLTAAADGNGFGLVDACPGEQHLVHWTIPSTLGGPTEVTVRRVADLGTRAQWRLGDRAPAGPLTGVAGMECASPDGSTVVALLRDPGEGEFPDRGRIVLIEDGQGRVVADDRDTGLLAVREGAALTVDDRTPRTVWRVDLSSGNRRRVRTLPAGDHTWVLSPDGSMVAGGLWHPAELVVVDLDGRRPDRSWPIGDIDSDRPLWVGNDWVVLPADGLRIADPSLGERHHIADTTAGRWTVVGNGLVGADHEALVALDVPGGERTRLPVESLPVDGTLVGLSGRFAPVAPQPEAGVGGRVESGSDAVGITTEVSQVAPSAPASAPSSGDGWWAVPVAGVLAVALALAWARATSGGASRH